MQSLEEKTAQPTRKSIPCKTIVTFRPLRVEIYQSAVSTDCFHTKSISSEQQNILTYYLNFADESLLGVRLTCALNGVSTYVMCRQQSLYLLLDFQSLMFIFSGVGSSRLFTCVQLYTLLASCIFLLSTIFSRKILCFVQLCVYLISRRFSRESLK